MNTGSIKRKLRICKRCEFLCTRCPHAMPCAIQRQRVRPIECYLCWHNQGTVLPRDCALRRRSAQPVAEGAKAQTRRRATTA